MRTARLGREYDLTFKYTLFPLHPDTPPDGLTLEELFGGRLDVAASKARMVRLMAEEGLPYGPRTHTYNSRKAQELAKWAEGQDGGARIHDALYRAYFVGGINLYDTEQLLAVVNTAGFDREQAQQVIESRSHEDEVDADWERARLLGVTGVPTFAVGRSGVVGAQPYEVLESLAVQGGAVRKTRQSSEET